MLVAIRRTIVFGRQNPRLPDCRPTMVEMGNEWQPQPYDARMVSKQPRDGEGKPESPDRLRCKLARGPANREDLPEPSVISKNHAAG